ncbi:MAG: DUF1080 domain-containing protein [Limisphaerales bacterium]
MKPLLPLLLAATLAAHAAPVPLFDGKSFAGWDGDTNKSFRLVDGAMVGGSLKETVPRNEFLATTRRYTNFVLRLDFKLLGTEGFVNSGVQVRSERVPNHHEMAGYQVDIGDPEWWGCIYDESRRNKVMAKSDMKAIEPVLKRGDWNRYEIRCDGPRVVVKLNGVQTVDYTEEDRSLPQFGVIGLQIHGGGKGEAWFRNLSIEELP